MSPTRFRVKPHSIVASMAKCLELHCSHFKTLTLSMVFFKYLTKILQHSNLNGASMKILKTKQQMYSHWPLPVFAVVMVMSVGKHYIIMTITR